MSLISCRLFFLVSVPSQAKRGLKNSFVVVVAGNMIIIGFCLEGRSSKVEKAMNLRPDYFSGTQNCSNNKLSSEVNA